VSFCELFIHYHILRNVHRQVALGGYLKTFCVNQCKISLLDYTPIFHYRICWELYGHDHWRWLRLAELDWQVSFYVRHWFFAPVHYQPHIESKNTYDNILGMAFHNCGVAPTPQKSPDERPAPSKEVIMESCVFHPTCIICRRDAESAVSLLFPGAII
jgi:hypothetical protein